LDVDGGRDEVSPPPDDPPQAANKAAIKITKRAPIDPRTFLLDNYISFLRNVRSCVVLNFSRLLSPIGRFFWELARVVYRKIILAAERTPPFSVPWTCNLTSG
jgi:hypothetical protein